MTTSFILSCFMWVQSLPSHSVDIKVDEYGMAHFSHQIENFIFAADVFEEKINYVQIEHVPTKVQSSSYTLEWPQNSLTTRMRVADTQSSLDCTLKKIVSDEKQK